MISYGPSHRHPAHLIRRYTGADEDAVVDLWSAAARAAHPFIDGEGEGARARQLREVYLVTADNWVAESCGRTVGLLGMLGAEIGGLFVAVDAQGQGVGRSLVEHAAALHGDLTVDVYELNTRARQFYEHMAFTEQSRRIDDETGHILITMLRRGSSPHSGR
jgi:putative acetyltransferase